MIWGCVTISRLLKIIGLFCRIYALLSGSFAKETYNFKEPSNQSLTFVPLLRTHSVPLTHTLPENTRHMV